MRFKDMLLNHGPVGLRAWVQENDYMIDALSNFLELEYSDQRITPSKGQIMSSFHLVSMDPWTLFPNSLRVVFLFQDVYPTPGAACGVATASLNGHIQETLKNMWHRLKETSPPGSIPDLPNGDIRGWCTQGVLLTNVAMTTRERVIMGHMSEWKSFTESLLEWMSDTFPFLVFVFFGKEARALQSRIDGQKHKVITTSHPSGRGYYAGFHESNIFNEVNEALESKGYGTINWAGYSYKP